MKTLIQQRKFIVLGLCLMILIPMHSFSQENEENKGKYKIKIITEVNGDKQIIEKTYDNVADMKADPELKDLDIHVDGDHHYFKFDSNEEGNKSIKKSIIISGLAEDLDIKKMEDFDFGTENLHERIEELMDGFDQDFGNRFKFFFDSEHGDSMKFDFNGNMFRIDSMMENFHKNFFLFKDGEPIDFDDLDIEFFDNEDGSFDFKWEDQDGNEHHDVKVFKFKSNGDDGEGRIKVFIGTNKITITDIDRDDKRLKELGFTPKQDLELEDLTYYPNPTDGVFTLRFRAEAGNPLQVKIFDMVGREVFDDRFNSFPGLYDREIDLSDNDRGVYILQISQGSRAFSKKIVIE
ncbi:T9SS type A sorting domain-containing protein [Fulvivirgaceae bacterium BMA10]|uniref:T9SS type A sorting domain-containing protein n=1 Tax=Splendidivirga corallicola TaxID=3051826 RepID=A0ABT8KLL5_9BACT|nr:T9SS type A sorting domain-containing protein [Fulvivirgaceae bacterium BMA10]